MRDIAGKHRAGAECNGRFLLLQALMFVQRQTIHSHCVCWFVPLYEVAKHLARGSKEMKTTISMKVTDWRRKA